jgi:hypothetical protein
MGNFFSFILMLLLFAAGFLTIYLLIDFFEYLKKYNRGVWEELCFERPFGIPRQDFFFYPVRPLKLIPFIFAEDDAGDNHLGEYKKRIKVSLAGLAAVVAINFLFSILNIFF